MIHSILSVYDCSTEEEVMSYLLSLGARESEVDRLIDENISWIDLLDNAAQIESFHIEHNELMERSFGDLHS